VTHTRHLLVAHPSPDVYGSDRQLLESVDGARQAGWRVVVVLPDAGPLIPLLEERGARVQVLPFPVLRKSLLSAAGAARLVVESTSALVRLTLLLRRVRPDALYVNTVTNPIWLVAARLAGVPALCHVHEAEEAQPRVVRLAMTAPLLLARAVVANSAAARSALTDVVPRLTDRVEVVHNGVPGPADPPARRRWRPDGPARLALVGRVSPRKGTDVALEALAALRVAGRDVELDVYGSVFPGYEWYLEELNERAAREDLRGTVRFHGYVHPTWPALASSDVVLVPSRVEPFGNTAVEAMLARRPVVASRVQGLAEVVRDGETGVLVPPDDPAALARAVAELLDDPQRADGLAEAGLADASSRFSVTTYRSRIAAALDRLPSGTRR
jgi:glycosyltransferase involved in cell wall biosynthesis